MFFFGFSGCFERNLINKGDGQQCYQQDGPSVHDIPSIHWESQYSVVRKSGVETIASKYGKAMAHSALVKYVNEKD